MRRQVLLDTNARGMQGFTAKESTMFVALVQRFIVNLEDRYLTSRVMFFISCVISVDAEVGSGFQLPVVTLSRHL